MRIHLLPQSQCNWVNTVNIVNSVNRHHQHCQHRQHCPTVNRVNTVNSQRLCVGQGWGPNLGEEAAILPAPEVQPKASISRPTPANRSLSSIEEIMALIKTLPLSLPLSALTEMGVVHTKEVYYSCGTPPMGGKP